MIRQPVVTDDYEPKVHLAIDRKPRCDFLIPVACRRDGLWRGSRSGISDVAWQVTCAQCRRSILREER